MTGDNLKYGKMITDGKYIQSVIEDMQDKINNQKNIGEYSEDGMKDVILNELDELEIYPADIDYIFSELEF
jgi:hypothetical protein